MLKKFFSDFKEFAMKGNVIDMALGVVIGSAFGKIVSSFVADVITPFISLITGNVNLTDLKAVLRPAELNEAGEVVRAEVALTYGNFLPRGVCCTTATSALPTRRATRIFS